MNHATQNTNLIPHSIRDCPFDISSKDLFGFVFGDKCGVVESIAFSPNNTTLAYAGTPSHPPQPQIATATCTSSTSRVTPCPSRFALSSSLMRRPSTRLRYPSRAFSSSPTPCSRREASTATCTLSTGRRSNGGGGSVSSRIGSTAGLWTFRRRLRRRLRRPCRLRSRSASE